MPSESLLTNTSAIMRSWRKEAVLHLSFRCAVSGRNRTDNFTSNSILSSLTLPPTESAADPTCHKRRRMKARHSILRSLALALVLAQCGALVLAQNAGLQENWVSTWAASPQQPPGLPPAGAG